MELLREEEEEEEYGKCRKHPSYSRIGVCPICLKSRLILLCPNCANLRPCVCYQLSDTASSSTSSSSSLSSTDFGIGFVGRMSFLIDSEPSFRRSRSAVFQFVRTRSGDRTTGFRPCPPEKHRWTYSLSSFFSFLKLEKKKKAGEVKKAMPKQLPRSKSMGFACYSGPDDISGQAVRLKLWPWFPSPIKPFQQPKSAKVRQEHSSFYRG